MTLSVAQVVISSLYLVLSLFVLVKGADLFLSKAKQIGNSFGLSHFAIGILIVAFGTSLPELASSLVAVFQGSNEIVIANVIGSNITNILFIVGLLAVIAGRIAVDHSLVKTELPIFFIATALFVMTISDGVVDRPEALLLLGTFFTYLWYLFYEAPTDKSLDVEQHEHTPIDYKSIGYVLLGLIAILVGAHYTVEMTVNIATFFSVPVGLVTIAAIAFGTSLPELFVSLRALRSGEVELAIGNIFGSNAFNLLVVIGVPALITPLTSEPAILGATLPVLIAASAIFLVTGFSQQIMRWEGMMMLLFFAFFVFKLIAVV
jgi:cation:H+ antiporter